jgi:hypothetical protein
MRRSYVLATIVLLSVLSISLIPLVFGAGHNPNLKPTPLNEGQMDHFPTWEEMEADLNLKAKYTGDNKLIVHVGQCT